METSTSEEFGSGFELIDIDMYYEDYAEIGFCFPGPAGATGADAGGAGGEIGAGAGTTITAGADAGVAGTTAGAATNSFPSL